MSQRGDLLVFVFMQANHLIQELKINFLVLVLIQNSQLLANV